MMPKQCAGIGWRPSRDTPSRRDNLGVSYETGRGVPQDDAEAVRWYWLAADQGVALAQSTLGLMYSIGRGVPQDEAEAVRWYRLAAEQGLASAQYNLGVSYETGRAPGRAGGRRRSGALVPTAG